ncbi:MAG: hypothetical protein V3W14_00630 [Candidatus Neomarinimicrobiota bacterium]
MFDPSSRYNACETATYKTPEGRLVAYKRRRFLPQGEQLPVMAEATVTEGDRLDNITARYLGNPEQYWRICDANNTMYPGELTVDVGRNLIIPMPQV